MTITDDIAKLVAELEYLVGSETYNPKSYNGWTKSYGCGYRYPVNYCRNEEDFENRKLTPISCKIVDLDYKYINTIKYMYGSNHLYIGNAIVNILNYLEEYYKISFDELEAQKIQERIDKMNEMKKELDSGEEISIYGSEFGLAKYVVGIDIPEGKYTLKYNDFIEAYIYNADKKLIRTIDVIKNKARSNITLKNGQIIKFAYPCCIKSRK